MTSSSMSDFGDPGPLALEPERTSILAVLSLICSLLCCIPGFGLLGSLMGVGALVSIGGSNGRVGGKGLAWAGVILGLLATLLWGGVAIGGGQAYRAMQTEFAKVDVPLRALDQGDFATARTLLTPAAQAQATDEVMATFRDAYRDQLGALGNQPTTLRGWWAGWVDNSQAMQNFSGQQVIPLVYSFDQSPSGLIVLIPDPQMVSAAPDPSSPFIGTLKNIQIPLPDGTVLELLP